MTETSKDKIERRLTGKCFGRYIFNIQLSGIGDTPLEAWEEAVDGFCNEPGNHPDEYDFEKEDEASW